MSAVAVLILHAHDSRVGIEERGRDGQRSTGKGRDACRLPGKHAGPGSPGRSIHTCREQIHGNRNSSHDSAKSADCLTVRGCVFKRKGEFETSVLRHVPWNRVLLRREINSLAGRRTGNTSQSLLMTRLLAVRAGAPTPIFRNQKLNPMWV